MSGWSIQFTMDGIHMANTGHFESGVMRLIGSEGVNEGFRDD